MLKKQNWLARHHILGPASAEILRAGRVIHASASGRNGPEGRAKRYLPATKKNIIRLGLTVAVGFWLTGRNEVSALPAAALGYSVPRSSQSMPGSLATAGRLCAVGSHRVEDLLGVQDQPAWPISRLVGVCDDD
jgi:hypothetical protein